MRPQPPPRGARGGALRRRANCTHARGSTRELHATARPKAHSHRASLSAAPRSAETQAAAAWKACWRLSCRNSASKRSASLGCRREQASKPASSALGCDDCAAHAAPLLGTASQEGIDDLNSRLRPPERVPTLPVAELIAPAPVAAAAALADAAPARPPSLVEIATEVALLNALSEVLARHHEAAQERASAAATRLQRAEAHAASLDAADIDPLPLASPEEEEMLALEYPTTPDDDASAARQLVPASASPPADASVLGGASAMLRRYRDARAEARDAAARDAALVARSRELLALTTTAHDDGDEQRSPRSPMPRHASPRDHTPASSGAMVLRSSAPRGLDVAAAAARTASGEALRNLLDFALSDADFGRVLSLLAAAGGHAGPAPASPDAIRAFPELGSGGADAAELDARECPVCLAELGAGGAVKAMPCGSRRVPHAFHAACIERWLGMHNSCPTCRTALAEPPRATTPDAAL